MVLQIILLVLLILVFLFILIAGGMNREIHYTNWVSINRPLEEVFHFFREENNLKKWVNDFSEIKKTGNSEIENCKFSIYYKGRSSPAGYQVKKWDENKKIILLESYTHYKREIRFQFYAFDKSSTRVVNINIMQPNSWLKRAYYGMKRPVLLKYITIQNNKLKMALEKEEMVQFS